MKMILLTVPCKDDKEAAKVAQKLLEKKLIVCAKRMPVKSTYFWKGKIENDSEVLLILESVEKNFSKIEKEIRKIHSYETFVLTAVPVLKYSKGVKKWMEEGLK